MDSRNEDLHDDLLDWAIIGASRMAHGLTDFESWSRAMLAEEHSESIRPFLPVIFDNSKKLLERTENIFDAAEERRQKIRNDSSQFSLPMNASGDDTSTQLPPRGIAAGEWSRFSEEEKRIIQQRRQIYEEEKRSIQLEQKRSAPMFSKRTKIVAGVYLLGCVLTYFGIPQSIIELCGTGQWKYQPETELFRVLVESAVQLIRPFLAVWVIAVPCVLVVGLFFWGADVFEGVFRFFRRLFHRDHE